MNIKILKSILISFTLIFSLSANASLISVIDGSHSVIKGWASNDNCTSCTPNSQFDGLDALGHTSTLFSNSASGWSSAFSSLSNIVIAEQQAGYYVNIADLTTFVSNGGHFIQLGGSSPSYSVLDKFFGTTFGGGSSLIGNHYVTTDAIGTAFEGYTGFVDNESSSHGFNTASLLSAWGGKSLMANSGQTSVWQGTLGSGTFTYLGYDYCCSYSLPDTRDAWSEVLDIAISAKAIPEPSTLAIFTFAILGLASRRSLFGDKKL